jgi:hypothetical protein
MPADDFREPTPWGIYLLCGLLSVLAVAAIAAALCGYQAHHPRDDSREAWEVAGFKGSFIGGYIAAGATVASTLFFVVALLLQMAELRAQRGQFQREMERQRQQASDAMALAVIVQILGSRAGTAVDAISAVNPEAAPAVATIHIERQAEIIRALIEVVSDARLRDSLHRAARTGEEAASPTAAPDPGRSTRSPGQAPSQTRPEKGRP